MDNPKFLKTIIVALFLLNIGMVLFMFLHRPGDGRPPEPKDIIIRELGLDDAQQNLFKGLREAHQAEMRAIREKNAGFRKNLYLEIGTAKPDSVKINSLADSITVAQKQAELVTFDHFKKLRAICRPEQQAKFDLMIAELVQNMLQPMRRERK